ncbi:MAG: response regulator transcription factor [Steroidobacteraceae bacterium]
MAKVRAAQQLPVAVVDDDPGVRRAIQNLLSSARVSSRGFRAAESFLKASCGQRFGCLVVDIDLPGMSGLALHEHLERSGMILPTIVLTAHDGPIQRRSGHGPPLVAIKVLRKPFRDSEFLSAVRSALRRARRPAAPGSRLSR